MPKKKSGKELPPFGVINPYDQKEEPEEEEADPGFEYQPVEYEKSPYGGNRIKASHDQPKVDNGKILAPGPIQGVIVGKPGSGKSRLVLTIVCQLKITQLVIFSKVEGSPLYQDLFNYCHEKGIQFLISYELGNAAPTMERAVGEKKPESWGLVIFDDFNETDTSKSNPYTKFSNNCVGKLRNYQYHFINICQTYTGISTHIRGCSGVRWVFESNDINALNRLSQDWVSMTGHNKEEFDGLCHIIRKVKHSYFMFGDDGRVFIYFADKDQLMPVDFDDPEQVLDDDENLHKLCHLIKDTESSNAYQLYQRNNAKKKLMAYIKYLCQTLDVDENTILDYIYTKYKF